MVSFRFSYRAHAIHLYLCMDANISQNGAIIRPTVHPTSQWLNNIANQENLIFPQIIAHINGLKKATISFVHHCWNVFMMMTMTSYVQIFNAVKLAHYTKMVGHSKCNSNGKIIGAYVLVKIDRHIVCTTDVFDQIILFMDELWLWNIHFIHFRIHRNVAAAAVLLLFYSTTVFFV